MINIKQQKRRRKITKRNRNKKSQRERKHRKKYTYKNRKNYKGGRVTKVPALQTYDVGSPNKVAFDHIQQQNTHQNAINNGTSILNMKGGNEQQTVPQIHTGMAPSPIDANNQAVGSASNLLQTGENSKYDACLTNPNCMNQNGGKRKKSRKSKKSRRNK